MPYILIIPYSLDGVPVPSNVSLNSGVHSGSCFKWNVQRFDKNKI